MSVRPPDRDRLIEAARAAAESRGWPWLEPVEVERESAARRTWVVRTNCEERGQNVRITLREDDLAVMNAAFLPR